MEYDRALFRVYERIMEDLNASDSPLTLTSASSSSHTIAASAAVGRIGTDNADIDALTPGSRSGLRRRGRGQNASGSDNGELNDPTVTVNNGTRDDENGPDSPNSDDRSSSDGNNNDNNNNDNNRESRQRNRRRRQRQRQQAQRQMPLLDRRQFSSTMQQQRRHDPLPFILPIWMSRKIDRMNHVMVDSGWLSMMTSTMLESNVSVMGRQVWSVLRDRLPGLRGGVPHTSYDSVATSSPSSQHQQPFSPLGGGGGGDASSSSHHRDDDSSSLTDVEEGGPLQLTPLDTTTDNSSGNLSPGRSPSNEGLRRRSPGRRGGQLQEQQNIPSSPSSSQSDHTRTLSPPPIPRTSGTNNNTALQPRVTNPPPPSFSPATFGGDGGQRITAPERTLAQRAIQMQLRQRERFSFGRRQRRQQQQQQQRNEEDSSSDGESDDGSSSSDIDTDDSSNSSSDDNDNDDDDGHRNNGSNEGCSQANLYIAMRLSFAVAIFHIFVLISLHATYVGPHAFHRQTQVVSLMQRFRRLAKTVDGFQNDLLKRGLVLGDEFDNADEKEIVPTTLYNCISYALSTRPIEERSNYFFGEDTKDASSPAAAAESNAEDNNISRRRYLDHSAFSSSSSSGSYDDDDDEEDLDDDDMYYFHESYDSIPHFGKKNATIDFGSSAVLDGDDGLDDDDDDDASNRYAFHKLRRAMPESSSNSNGGATKTSLPSIEKKNVPLFGMDEILQIKILYGGGCTGRCSRVKKVVYSAEAESAEDDNGDSNSTEVEESADQKRLLSRVAGALDEHDNTAGQNLRGQRQTQKREILDRKTKEDGDKKVDELSSPAYWEKVHYRFAIDDALLFLDEKSALRHNITVVNVTVTERCLSTGSDDGKITFLTSIGEFLSQMYGMDSIIINQLMYGIRGIDGTYTSGYVKSMETQERWGWHKEQLEAFDHNSFMEWVMKKIGILFMSTLAFFLITSVTSLIVRVLTSSGVVLMFPLFSCFRVLGLPGADERILALSYPWIGSARAAIANENIHPQSHLVWANVTKILLYYVMYEACQAAWSVVLYAKSIPEALPVWIYGFAMIWEYFSMVFVRSALSVHFFPRVAFLYFLFYHIYFYSVPYGYFDVALIPLFLLMLHAMVYTILALEAPNSARGVVNVECPREVYNRLSWPEPVAALPAEWTMFLPLNSRLSPLHDREISNATGTTPNNGVDNGREEDDASAGADDNDAITAT